jgi:adenylylsulfate kinase-like enzyme
MARELLGEGEFLEIFIDTPIEICMQRDPKGLYEKAKAGKIRNFTGIDSPYELPERAELVIKTVQASPEDHAQAIVKHLRDMGYLG